MIFDAKVKHALDRIRYLLFRGEYWVARLCAPYFRGQEKYRSLWIISERGREARDNAYHLYAYICREHPEINIRYIISKDSPDRKKIEALGRPAVNYRSFEHYLVFALSDVKISTHIMGYSPDLYYFWLYNKKKEIPGIKIFLQHGIIKDDIRFLYASNVSLDLFVCGAKREWEYISSAFGYQDGIVKWLGLCRYDCLPVIKSEMFQTILLMPTWRSYLAERSEAGFKRSDYFKIYQSLLSNPVLHNMLRHYGFRLLFYPHYSMQRFASAFQPKSELITLCDIYTDDIQELLIRSDLLITDYSSVFFDYGYMGKPVIYYQFDQEVFFKEHYGQGYFQYERDGFGPVVTEEDALLSVLKYYLQTGCKIETIYQERANAFFGVRDQKNCKRNFAAICTLTEKGMQD